MRRILPLLLVLGPGLIPSTAFAEKTLTVNVDVVSLEDSGGASPGLLAEVKSYLSRELAELPGIRVVEDTNATYFLHALVQRSAIKPDIETGWVLVVFLDTWGPCGRNTYPVDRVMKLIFVYQGSAEDLKPSCQQVVARIDVNEFAQARLKAK